MAKRAFLWVTVFLLFAPLRLQAQDDLQVITADNAAQLQELARYGDGVLTGALAWSPDGNTLAVGGTLGVWLYDATDWEAEPRFLEFGAEVRDLAFTPDGTLLAIQYGDSVHFWDIENAVEQASYSGKDSFAISPDGQLLAVGSSAYSELGSYWSTIQLYDLTTRDQLVTLEEDGGTRVVKLEFSADNSLLNATIGVDGDYSGCYRDDHQFTRIWDVSHLEELTPTSEPIVNVQATGLGRLLGTDMSADGTMMVAGTHAILNPQTGAELVQLEGLTRYDAAAFSPDSRLLMLNDNVEFNDYILRVIDTSTGEELSQIVNRGFRTLSFSPDGSVFVAVEKSWLMGKSSANKGINPLVQGEKALLVPKSRNLMEMGVYTFGKSAMFNL